MDDQPDDKEQRVDDPLDGHRDPACPIPPAGQSDDAIEEAVRPWRLARALDQLRSQINAAFPDRRKASDGTVGDPAHQARTSDHNPWIVDGGSGVVTALDITHDPASGCDGAKIAAALVGSRDQRIKYIIWNRRIASSAPIGNVAAWTWRTYTGANPHNHHFHLSVKSGKPMYDDTTPWAPRTTTEAPFDDAEVAVDADADVLNALSTIGAGVDPDGPALAQLVAARDTLDALLSIYRGGWAPATDDDGLEASAPDFARLKPEYERLFAEAKVRDQWRGTVGWYLTKLRGGRDRYEEVAAKTGVPWWFVGITHAMEASFNFAGHLHNGDPLIARTVQVPRNRPKIWNPPNDWLTSAVDALECQGFLNQTDWSLARVLYRFEGFNGYGYHAKGINSPYLWSFSNQYSKGKFVADHRYDANAVSKQCGAAVMLRALADAGDIAAPK